MKKDKDRKLFLVDDDAVYLKLLEIEFLLHTDFAIETYATGELCIAHLSHNPDMIVLDYHLDGLDRHAMNGIATLDKIKAFNTHIPVVLLSSQDEIEEAINCISHKALDYIVKGETAFMRLQNSIATFFLVSELRS